MLLDLEENAKKEPSQSHQTENETEEENKSKRAVNGANTEEEEKKTEADGQEQVENERGREEEGSLPHTGTQQWQKGMSWLRSPTVNVT